MWDAITAAGGGGEDSEGCALRSDARRPCRGDQLKFITALDSWEKALRASEAAIATIARHLENACMSLNTDYDKYF